MSKATNELLYWLVVFVAYWLMTYDGPPLRLMFAYYGAKFCRSIAVTSGYAGLKLEAYYYRNVRKVVS